MLWFVIHNLQACFAGLRSVENLVFCGVCPLVVDSSCVGGFVQKILPLVEDMVILLWL